MPIEFNLAAEPRSATASALRQKELIPAVLYGHGLKNQNIQLNNKAFSLIFNQAGYSALINLSLKGDKKDKTHPVLVRELQQDPVRDHILHVDFYQPRLDEVIRAHVPLNFVGEAPAVEDKGGVLVRALDEVEVEALPTDLPRAIDIAISSLTEFDTPLHISDLELSDGVTLLHEPDEVITLVQAPRTEEELEALEEEVSEDVEGVEGVEEDAEEEGEEGEEGDEEGEKVEADQIEHIQEPTEKTKPEQKKE